MSPESDAGKASKPLLRAMKGVRKQHLPSKICEVCARPFVWRRKWERVWNDVKFCSEACKRNKKGKIQ
ncbi:MAG: DUF2256 domain-containing protein [Pyrinomonadaceae bacterium]|nr:DUF2256 domain-containing protein [Pyrinomonadaceae bacterium]